MLTDWILAETVTRLRARTDAARAVAFAADGLRRGRYDLVFVDAGLLEGALAQMNRFGDKWRSLTDSASFEALDRLGLDESFTFDRDFRDCGYRAVP